MPTAESSDLAALDRLFACLSALHKLAHLAHQRVAGPSFYGDHLLLERVYTGLQALIDQLGERIVHTYGLRTIEGPATIEGMLQCARTWTAAGPDDFARLIAGTNDTRAALQDAADRVGTQGKASYGWDDYFSRADAQLEETLYLLVQRTRS